MESQVPLHPAPANRFERYAAWLVASTLATVAISWTAFQVQQEGLAPAVLFPLSVGAALGVVLSVISHLTLVPGCRAAVAAAIFWGLLVVVGQDYIGHRRHQRAYDDELERHGSLVAGALAADGQLRPTFIEYLSGRVRSQPAWWCVELLLTAGAAAAVTGYDAGRRQIPISNEA
jgi:uncharacterized membrane protein YdfJ with MMPL/SSD domain